MTRSNETKGNLNARLGKNIKKKKLRRDGKTLRRSLAGITLIGSIGAVLAMIFGQ